MVDDLEEKRKHARELFEARLDRLQTSGYLPVFEKMIRSMCAPFWWSSRDPNDPLAVVRQNGTICFVNTGELATLEIRSTASGTARVVGPFIESWMPACRRNSARRTIESRLARTPGSNNTAPRRPGARDSHPCIVEPDWLENATASASRLDGAAPIVVWTGRESAHPTA